jgi:Protein of unknown function (DUF4013)
MQTIDYGAAFGFFLKDKTWFKKFALASLLIYTLIGSIPVLGWTVEITRGVLTGGQTSLPDWSSFRSKWKTGYQYWLVNLVWLLPVLLCLLVADLPLFLVNTFDPNRLLVVWSAVLCCALVFITVYGAAVIFLLPAALGLLAESGSLARAINPLNAWRLARLHPVPHLIVFLIVGLGLTTVISLLAPLTLFLLLPPMLVYTGMVLAHYAGQLYRLQA